MRAALVAGVAAASLLCGLAGAGGASAHAGGKIPLLWLRLADCESGDGDGRPPYRPSWHYNGGSGFDGGLQFLPDTWDRAKRLYRPARQYRYAWQAHGATQVIVARRWLRITSWEQWPDCSRKIGVR